ncbi:MAG: hypothetical protein NXI13_13910 [Proteobacteria bacterium]|nr:hypothetical protein [Pseudomonadota bacterium]
MNIFIDIETIAGTDVPLDLMKVDSRLKDPAKIEAAKQAAVAKTSFDGAFGQIVSIAWAIDDGAISSVWRETEWDEKDILGAFFDNLKFELDSARTAATAQTYEAAWVGHNIAFDLGFLFKRSVVLDIERTVRFPWPVNPWDQQVFDTQYQWAGRGNYVKLDTLAYSLLGERKTDSGADVAGMWKRGEYLNIANYNRDDVRITREVFKRLSGVKEAA